MVAQKDSGARLDERRKLFRIARAKFGYSQVDVADRLTERLGREITLWRVFRIERGIQMPREDEILALIDVLHLPALRAVFPKTTPNHAAETAAMS